VTLIRLPLDRTLQMEIQTLLALPVSSSGFSALPLAPVYPGSDIDTGNESGSPPRKVIRLDSDADFSSVARPRKSHIRERQEGSIIIRVVGEPRMFHQYDPAVDFDRLSSPYSSEAASADSLRSKFPSVETGH
jgi:hypothetical protein